MLHADGHKETRRILTVARRNFADEAKNSTFSPKECIYVFCKALATNSVFWFIQH